MPKLSANKKAGSDYCASNSMDDNNRQKKLLIIEDDAEILNLLDLIFCEEGYNVVLSETGAESRELSTIRPDLVLLDLRLTKQGREGIEICTYIKSQLSTCHIPVILLSAERDIREVCLQCGADNYLSKPFDIDHLSGMVKELVLK